MALEKIEESILEQIKPQADVYVSELLKKLGVLINQVPKFDELEFSHGSFEDFFRFNRKKYMLTKMVWDGKDGHLFFMSSIEFAISFSSFLMGMSTASIAERVAKLDFDAELTEAYGEISNQLCGGLNQLLIAKIDKDIHLTLEQTTDLPEDGSKNGEAIGEGSFLYMKANVRIEGLEPNLVILALSDTLINDIFGVEFASTDSSGKLAASLDGLSVDKIMFTDYPTIDIKQSIGDAYDLMEDRKIDALPITEEGKVIRVISKNNVAIIRSVFFDAPGQEERISRLMCLPLAEVNQDQKLICLLPTDTVKKAAQMLVRTNISTIPVVNESGELSGVVTARRILDVLSKDS